MPSKYVIRNFCENCYYHVFNRGVEQRKIFLDKQDYNLFLYYLFIYLMPLEKILEKYPYLPLRLQSKNLSKQIEIITFSLMPNHFHFQFLQKDKNAISKLMQQVTIAYVGYFNKKYKRVGGLVQGKFRAVLVGNNELLLHVNRYIHLNPVLAGLVSNIEEYPWSSYPDYIGKPNLIMCSKNVILAQFPTVEKYKQFLNDHVDYTKQLDKIKHLLLDS